VGIAGIIVTSRRRRSSPFAIVPLTADEERRLNELAQR